LVVVVGCFRRLLFIAVVVVGCTTGRETPDAAPRADVNSACACTEGPHGARIFVLSDEGGLWSYDPIADAYELVVDPVCATTESPYSMAVDAHGVAWILYSDTRRIQNFDIVHPGACTDSGYLPTDAQFPLFGMGFARLADGCSSLFAHSYSGDGAFSEGPASGALGVIEGDPLRMRTLSAIDYDGGELSGTGDGHLFSFAGVSPAKLVQYDPVTGAVVETVMLRGLSKTNASAFAFYGGDFYFFTEALPQECGTCFQANCGTAYGMCTADPACNDQLRCAIERGRVTDECGGGVGTEMLNCLGTCSSDCLTPARARVSQVTRLDWDRSDGPDRSLTVIRTDSPIRVVGAGTSPCVPTVPF
jgi:hypothetical protein